jgi:hypothetical protein
MGLLGPIAGAVAQTPTALPRLLIARPGPMVEEALSLPVVTAVPEQPPAPDPVPVPVRPASASTAASEPKAAAPSGTAPLAVLIGVNHVSGSPTLEGSVNDMMRLRDALVAYGIPSDRILMLLEGDVTHDAVLSAVRRLALAPAESTVVFGYAGHGRKTKAGAGIAMRDGHSVLVSELAAAMAPIRAHLWATFTQCYAASFDVPGIAGPGRVLTFAASANGLSYEWAGSSALGRFMEEQAMLQGIASASVEEAFNYAREQMLAMGPEFTPRMDDRFDGELRLGPPIGRTSPASVPIDPPPPASAPDAPTVTAPPAASVEPPPTPAPTPATDCKGLFILGRCWRAR